MRLLFAVVVAVLATPCVGRAQTAPADGIAKVLRALESALAASDAAQFSALLAPGANTSPEFFDEWLEPGATRAVIKERLRSEPAGLAKGVAYDVYADALVEYGRTGRVGTLLIRMRGQTAGADQWRISELVVLTTVRGLYNLTLTATKQYSVANLILNAEDFELRVPAGSAFVAETDAGVTAIVILGRGDMTFSPTPAAEQGQVRIYEGDDPELSTRFDAVYLRAHPAEFDRRLDVTAFHAREVNPRDLRRADAIFQENLPLSFGIELADLSANRWTVIPKFGDIVAEMDTGRSHLTYMKSSSDAEDIRFFDRTRGRTIAIYASKEKLAARGPFFSEDDHSDFDIVNYQIEASFDPRREWIEGKATLLLTARRNPITTLIINLAEPLTVRSVLSRRHGHLMALRVSGQDDIIINLPQALRPDELLDLEFTYGGRLPAVPPEREALGAAGQGNEFVTVQQTPSYIYTGRSTWYPQGEVTDYATATLTLRVPEGYATVASGAPDDGYPKALPSDGRIAWMEYRFSATQPVRYLAWATSRFAHVDTAQISIPPPDAEADMAMTGVSYNVGEISVMTSPMHQRRARDLFDEALRVMTFYGSLVDDIPYQTFAVAIVERSQPGGHSPPYFAVLSQPPPGAPIVWRTDPAYFDDFPEFFLAHEAAHQWWGQAVGWKNYHEQWISEGFAQYSAALYAEHIKEEDTFRRVIAQMARWTLERSDQGPVYLGYRLGHIRNDGRIFRALVYNKGALTLHMLRRLIGDEAFFRGWRRFYTTWRFKKAGTEDVKAAFEVESKRDLDLFFDRWIYGATLPRLKFSYTTDATGVNVRLEQIGDRFEYPITVTLKHAASAVNVTIPVIEQVTTRHIPVAGTPRGVGINEDDATPVVLVR